MSCIQASLTLDLARDCARFTITFFGVISSSAPHIYHSALPLSPQTSIVHKMYKQYASPFFRVVQGIPVSWEPIVATAYLSDFKDVVVWSPCNKFIAVANHQSVEVVDSVTLSRLGIFQHSLDPTFQQLAFSPDSCCLALFAGKSIISWDLQTGGPLSAISSEKVSTSFPFSLTHSKDGKVVAVAHSGQHYNENGNVRFAIPISTYDLLSGTHMGACLVPEGQIVYPIWTHDEYLQCATINSGSIMIWQSAFTLKHPLVEVEALPIPDEITRGDSFLFLPTLSRLSFMLNDTIHIWDAKASKFLLKFDLTVPTQNVSLFRILYPPRGSFSPNGHFFAWVGIAGKVYVWRESPTGYLLHQQLLFPTYCSSPGPRLSPNGESIIMPHNSKIHQWHTRDQVPSPPSISIDLPVFVLSFSPNKKFVAFARWKGNIVTILDLQSGEPRWITDMGEKIGCLGMTRDTVIVICERTVITWNLSGGDYTVNTSINNRDGVQTTILNHPFPSFNPGMPIYMSTSPDLSHIVVARKYLLGGGYSLGVYDVSAGTCLAGIKTDSVLKPQFTEDGHEVWAGSKDSGEYCEIIGDSGSGTVQLKLQRTEDPSRVFFQESACGYEVTDGGRVLGPTGKRLLLLPHNWMSDEKNRTWGGQFLGLLHGELSEVVILEFLE